MTHGERIHLSCCEPTVYTPNGTTLIHSFMCEKSGKALTREEVSLWKMKAKEQNPEVQRWNSVNLLPPYYEDADPQWLEPDDDGGLDRSDSL